MLGRHQRPPPLAVMPLSGDDLTGYAACLVSSFMFGSNFVPVKRVYTGDGMFFTLMMTAAVFYEGCFIQLWQGNPKFEPVAMLGGALWATGNITVVPIVKTIGLGIGLLVWGLVSMLVGWASGHFGIFGVEPDPPLGAPWLNYLGVTLATASLGVYAKIKSEVAEGSDGSGGGERETGRDNRGGPMAPESEPLVGGSAVYSDDGSDVSIEDEWSGSRRGWVSGASIARPSTPSVDSARNRFAFGFGLSVVAGVFYGVNFNPPQHIIDEARRETSDAPVHSRESLDYVFSHFCGIFLATLVYFGIYCVIKRAKGQRPQMPNCVAPALVSGLMWGAGEISWFVANSKLSFSVTFPIISSIPGVVGALWAVLVFGEIKGKDNYVLLVVSGAMRLFAVVLIALSKEGL